MAVVVNLDKLLVKKDDVQGAGGLCRHYRTEPVAAQVGKSQRHPF